MTRWAAEDGAPVSLVVVPLCCLPGGLRDEAARLRRALRDVRDRMAQRSRRWGGVAIAVMVSGDGAAVVLVRHPSIVRQEIAEVFGRRWPKLTVGHVGVVSPSWGFAVED